MEGHSSTITVQAHVDRGMCSWGLYWMSNGWETFEGDHTMPNLEFLRIDVIQPRPFSLVRMKPS